MALHTDARFCDHADLIRQPYRSLFGTWVYRCRGCGTLIVPLAKPTGAQRAAMRLADDRAQGADEGSEQG